MVDGVMEAILMLLFLKSLRNGEEREWIDDDAEDFDFLGIVSSLIITEQQRNKPQQRLFFCSGSKFGHGRVSIIVSFQPLETTSCRTILACSPTSGF